MDFLFLNHSASVEAIIIFLSLGIIFLFLLYDVIFWVRQKYREIHPRASTGESLPQKVGENSVVEPSKEPELNSTERIEITEISIPDALVENTPSVDLPQVVEPTEANEEIPFDIGSMNVSGDVSIGENTDNTNIDQVTTVVSSEVQSGTEENGKINPPILVESLPNAQDISEEINLPMEISNNNEATELIQNEPILPAESIVNESLTEESLQESEKSPTHDAKLAQESEKPTKAHKKKGLSPEKKEKIVEIIHNVRTLIARGHIDEARTLIIKGLSLEKNNRELNLLMANLYEREHAFEKAEFLLKELAEADSEDTEVLSHLATVLAMQRKFEVSYEIYKKVLSIGGETEEVLYTLTHIASELSLTEDIYQFAKSYLKQYPKNPEILWLYSQSQITKADRKGAIETLIKLKNLTPYNQEIVDLISKLVTEDELAGNFSESIEK